MIIKASWQLTGPTTMRRLFNIRIKPTSAYEDMWICYPTDVDMWIYYSADIVSLLNITASSCGYLQVKAGRHKDITLFGRWSDKHST